MLRSFATSAPLRARILTVASGSPLPRHRPLYTRFLSQRGPANHSSSISSSKIDNPPQNPEFPGHRTHRNENASAGLTSKGVLVLAFLASGLIGFGLARSDFLNSGIKSVTLTTGYGSPEDFRQAIQELKETFGPEETAPGDLVTTNPDVLHDHGFSALVYHEGIPHSVVVFPRSTEDVVKIVRVATKYRMPVIPYAGATNLEGHTRGHPTGGICIDLSNMDQILEIHEADSDLVCQPGARWMDLNDALKEQGIPLFFPLDPGPGATIGGMLSTGCSGTNAVRYGTAKAEWFLNATVVLPSGEVIKTRRRSRKSSAGFDTTKLFIGAEGTLGIVTEVTIRLAPVLPTTVALANFPNVKKATEAVVEILNQGVGIQCIELLDDKFMGALNDHGISPRKRKYAVQDHLFFKFQGPTQASLKETASIVKKIVEKHGGANFSLARSAEEADDMWNDRKNAHHSGLALLPGAKGYPTDVCVPVSKLPQLVLETKQDLHETGLVSTIVGHVGDGNFHSLILMKDEEDMKKAKEAVHRMVKRAIALDGTCTGEHGVGVGKKEYLVEELGEGTVELMRTVKRAIDPLDLFNPGKLYPDPTPSTPTTDKHH
ncbi:D-lactate dehydrogenase [cytochrome], mitochondrial [Leucoagaricus sp. SymC.cos]|nr:D-lactate dehydrogenase [cytochrome], mitochondrial [Leucoagaricus sp. SymC.cos]